MAASVGPFHLRLPLAIVAGQFFLYQTKASPPLVPCGLLSCADDATAPQATGVTLLQAGVLVHDAGTHGNLSRGDTAKSNVDARSLKPTLLFSGGNVARSLEFQGAATENGFMATAAITIVLIGVAIAVAVLAVHICADDGWTRPSASTEECDGKFRSRDLNLRSSAASSLVFGRGAAGAALANVSLPRGSLPPPSSSSLPQPASGMGSGSSFAEVPAICPSLILPNTEARFLLDLEELHSLLAQGVGSVDIKGTSTRTLLHLIIDSTPTGQRRLVLSSVGCKEHPRTTVLANGPGELEVYGKHNKLYGSIDVLPSGRGCVLKKADTPVMQVQHPPGELAMSATATDGSLLGGAAQVDYRLVGASGQASNRQAFKLTVRPGSDAVLIFTCMMSVLFFAPGSSAPLPTSSAKPSLVAL